ncbi:glycoside hydrolase family 88 protein [Telluria beijingensis]|uniref:glycoside hydrolase family 88 protein n=1 Tax=Telluria beijingensis TaxID=3068633 RepID=UPI002795E31F|nr:glycoside hydrolase family 88 protein [Massilia sp. REN29]
MTRYPSVGTAAARLVVALSLAGAATCAMAQETVSQLVQRSFDTAAVQYGGLLDKVQRKPGFPRTTDKGEVVLVGPGDWTAGFFPGSLWYLYEHTGDTRWRLAAADYTARTAPAKFDKSQHDLGFMLGAGYGNGYRLTGDPAYRDALLAGATTLVTRFNPKVGSIQSWDLWKNSTWAFPVIVDNLMNLELLTWAARSAVEPRYREVAVTHADTTLRNHFRPDGSSYHLVDYDPQTGKIRSRVTVQGNADASSWARGQAWALYGYTMMYRETKKEDYLRQAHKIASFFMQHPRLPADKVPYWDFDDPAIPNAPRDSSAAAIVASSLLELASFSSAEQGRAYRAFAEAQLRSLASTAYLASGADNGGFLLKHATGHKPAGKEIDVPLNYGDYYFLEALLRLKRAPADR